MKILVAGVGGFIGHHLVNQLKAEGYWVRGVDLKRPEFASTLSDEFYIADLRHFESCLKAADGMDDSHMLEAARVAGTRRYLYTSSACVYPEFLQGTEDVSPLREAQAIPADPEKGYGWEKLFAEQMATYYQEEFKLDVRIIRFHNIYGPLGTYEGGKEKAPVALCRKVALAEDGSSIEVWGDGQQTRSFCYITDCIKGLCRIMESGYTQPINLGSDELVTVNDLLDIVCAAAGKRLQRRHDMTKPQGVRGRNSDNSLLKETVGWEPETPLREGIKITYDWINAEITGNKFLDAEFPKNRR